MILMIELVFQDFLTASYSVAELIGNTFVVVVTSFNIGQKFYWVTYIQRQESDIFYRAKTGSPL